MTRDERERAEGFTNVATDDDCEYHLLISDYVRVRDAWMGGKSFVDGTSVYGEKVTIKCARIISITELTPASMAERIRNEKEREDKQIYDH